MLALALKADLEGYVSISMIGRCHNTDTHSVTDLLPQDTEDEPFHYTFKVQCTSCREVHPNWVTVNRHVCSTSPSVVRRHRLTHVSGNERAAR